MSIKTILSYAIAVLMLFSNPAFAASHMEVVEKETVYEASENCFKKTKIKNEEEKSEAVFLGGIQQLSKPTGLTWNKDETGKDKKGWISWDAVPNCEGEYIIAVYCGSKEKMSVNWSGLYDTNGNGRISVDVISDSIFDESGTYTFSVQARGDGIRYSRSEAAYSDEYNFVCPSTKLQAPENLRWVGDGVLRHSSVKNACGYMYCLYNQDKDEQSGFWYCSDTISDEGGYMEEDLSSDIIDLANNNKNLTGVYVSVTALTENIEKYQNSPMSEMSPIYNLGSKQESIGDFLGSIMNDLNSGEVSAEEALDSFLEDMERREISNTDIAVSMSQDESMVNNIKNLEEEYCKEKSIAVSVNDSASAGYLSGKGIDVDEVSVVGAALNSQSGNDVSINFSEGDSSLSKDELFYKNSIALNIGIDGVKDAKKLDIPIQIKMPAPTNVLPDRLVILHYHADGTYETIRPKMETIYGKTYVTFVLTSFSEFVFCNAEANVSVSGLPEKAEFKGYDYTGDVLVASYDASGRCMEIKKYVPGANITAELKDGYSSVKVMWWDSVASPKAKFPAISIN